jgi:hypothetical protein
MQPGTPAFQETLKGTLVRQRLILFINDGILNLFLIDPSTSLPENQVAIQLRRGNGLQNDDLKTGSFLKPVIHSKSVVESCGRQTRSDWLLSSYKISKPISKYFLNNFVIFDIQNYPQ